MPEIAEALEEEEVRVERIVELLEEYGSDNTDEVVTKALDIMSRRSAETNEQEDSGK